eukprot:1453443-Rhodomonas_salina.3
MLHAARLTIISGNFIPRAAVQRRLAPSPPQASCRDAFAREPTRCSRRRNGISESDSAVAPQNA